jgi:hypothetical protein
VVQHAPRPPSVPRNAHEERHSTSARAKVYAQAQQRAGSNPALVSQQQVHVQTPRPPSQSRRGNVRGNNHLFLPSSEMMGVFHHNDREAADLSHDSGERGGAAELRKEDPLRTVRRSAAAAAPASVSKKAGSVAYDFVWDEASGQEIVPNLDGLERPDARQQKAQLAGSSAAAAAAAASVPRRAAEDIEQGHSPLNNTVTLTESTQTRQAGTAELERAFEGLVGRLQDGVAKLKRVTNLSIDTLRNLFSATRIAAPSALRDVDLVRMTVPKESDDASRKVSSRALDAGYEALHGLSVLVNQLRLLDEAALTIPDELRRSQAYRSDNESSLHMEKDRLLRSQREQDMTLDALRSQLEVVAAAKDKEIRLLENKAAEVQKDLAAAQLALRLAKEEASSAQRSLGTEREELSHQAAQYNKLQERFAALQLEARSSESRTNRLQAQISAAEDLQKGECGYTHAHEYVCFVMFVVFKHAHTTDRRARGATERVRRGTESPEPAVLGGATAAGCGRPRGPRPEAAADRAA